MGDMTHRAAGQNHLDGVKGQIAVASGSAIGLVVIEKNTFLHVVDREVEGGASLLQRSHSDSCIVSSNPMGSRSSDEATQGDAPVLRQQLRLKAGLPASQIEAPSREQLLDLLPRGPDQKPTSAWTFHSEERCLSGASCACCHPPDHEGHKKNRPSKKLRQRRARQREAGTRQPAASSSGWPVPSGSGVVRSSTKVVQ
mmetsp:Transcript_64654/g.179299  ORF Transcript_64654/g.179299 Transcript_64654/m.179299 type:complete len:198 (-) Transcript_64654:389-982(-)